MKNQWFTGMLTLLSAIPLVAMPAQAEPTATTEKSADIPNECSTPDCSVSLNTWSVVGAEEPAPEGPRASPENPGGARHVGVAAASCTPLVYIDGAAVLVPEKGVATVQAVWTANNRDFVLRRLKEGASATQLAQEVMNPRRDRGVGLRQYGFVTFDSNGKVDTATATGRRTMQWSGGFTDNEMAVTTQGNILANQAVAEDALTAFQTDGPSGKNTLADRLMRALEAGSAAGGDRRCGPQKSASAFILVARATDPPYATTQRTLFHTDMFTDKGPWLALSVIKRKSSSDAVARLREYYDAWRTAESLPTSIPSSDLNGNWRSNDYQCGGAFRDLNLDVSVSGTNIQGVKNEDQGYACIRTGSVSFAGTSLPATLPIGKSFPVTMTTGTPRRPGSGRLRAFLRVISPTLFEILPGSRPGRAPAWILHFSKN